MTVGRLGCQLFLNLGGAPAGGVAHRGADRVGGQRPFQQRCGGEAFVGEPRIGETWGRHGARSETTIDGCDAVL